MDVLMIRCPNTEKSISTGLRMDAVFHSMPVFFSSTRCPSCGSLHKWFARDAWVCDCGPENCDPNCDKCKMPRPKGRSESHHND